MSYISSQSHCLTYIKLVSNPHELFGGVDLVGVNFLDGLLSVVHQLEKLVGPCQVIKLDVILLNCYRGVHNEYSIVDTTYNTQLTVHRKILSRKEDSPAKKT